MMAAEAQRRCTALQAGGVERAGGSTGARAWSGYYLNGMLVPAGHVYAPLILAFLVLAGGAGGGVQLHAAVPDEVTAVAGLAPADPDAASFAHFAVQAPLHAALSPRTRAIAAGNALFFGGVLIQYGLVYPQAQRISPDNLGDQLALLSPQLLATGLRYAGVPLAVMRTSEGSADYVRITGGAPTPNHSWKGYFTGWGFTLAAGVLGTLGSIGLLDDFADTPLERYSGIFTTAARITGVCADVTWGLTALYSLWYLRSLIPRHTHAPPASRLTLHPVAWSGRDGGGGGAIRIAVRPGSRHRGAR